MILLPFRRPAIGISLGDHGISTAMIRRPWLRSSMARVRRAAHTPLPSGFMTWGQDEVAIADETSLIAHLRRAVPARTPTPVALGLPTRCATMALLDFDQFPSDRKEQLRLIQWRHRALFDDVSSDTRLEYRIWPMPCAEAANRVRIWTSAIAHNLLDRVTTICARSGLLPGSIGIEGCHLFDLHRPIMDCHEETAFASGLNNDFFFVAVRRGIPYFVRVKRLLNGASTFEEELANTLDYVVARHPHLKRAETPLHLFVLAAGRTTSNMVERYAGDPHILPIHTEVEPTIVRTDINHETLPSGWPDSATWMGALTSLAAVGAA